MRIPQQLSRFRCVLALLSLLTATAVSAADAPQMPAPLPQPRHDWGCEVLLCLSNPNGPTAVRECVPPIQRLWRALARGQAMPRCGLSDGRDSRVAGSWAERATNHYELCPAGTQPLAAGHYALDARDVSPRPTLHVGIGDGANLEPRRRRPASSLPPLVCVGTLVRSQPMRIRRQRVEVGVYERLESLAPRASGHVIDLYIDHTRERRVRL